MKKIFFSVTVLYLLSCTSDSKNNQKDIINQEIPVRTKFLYLEPHIKKIHGTGKIKFFFKHIKLYSFKLIFEYFIIIS